MNGALRQRLVAYCQHAGIPVGELVANLLEPVITGVEPIPAGVLPRVAPPEPAPVTDRNSYIKAVLAEFAAAARVADDATSVAIPLSSELIEQLETAVERGATVGGQPATIESLFEAAIVAMLDQFERQPRSGFCGLCTRDIVGSSRRLPVGINDELLEVCYTCDTEHPRKGRYSFDGGREAGAGTQDLRNTGRVGRGR